MVAGATVLWLAGIAAGVVAFQRHASTPGPVGTSPTHWPIATPLARQAGRMTVVMFVHAECPCTRASIGELAVATRAVPPADLVIVMRGESARVRERGAALGARVVTDPGVLAHDFGAATSGFTVAYDAAGELRFAGGITESRGHVGANAGRLALHTLLVGGTPTIHQQPAFGCGLEDPS